MTYLPTYLYTGQKHISSEHLYLDPEVEAKLHHFYQPYNQQLYELIGRDLSWEGKGLKGG